MKRAEYKVLEAHDAKAMELEIYKLNNTPLGPVAWKPILMSSATVGGSVRTTVIVEHIIESGPDEMTEEQAKRIIEIYGQLPEEVKAKK